MSKSPGLKRNETKQNCVRKAYMLLSSNVLRHMFNFLTKIPSSEKIEYGHCLVIESRVIGTAYWLCDDSIIDIWFISEAIIDSTNGETDWRVQNVLMVLDCVADKQQFLDVMRTYMPPAHARFIIALRQAPSIRDFGNLLFFVSTADDEQNT